MSLYVITLIEAKADLGLPDTSEDAVLTRHMEGLQGRIESYIGRPLVRTVDVEEILDGGVGWLLLSRFPVESVKTVHVDATQTWTAATLLESTEYLLHKTRGRLIRSGTDCSWPSGSQNIRVVYTGGYSLAGSEAVSGQESMPEALRGAMSMQLGFEWRNRRTLGAQSVGSQGQTLSLAPAKFLPAVIDVLTKFQRV